MEKCTVKGCKNFGRYCRLHLQIEVKPATAIKKQSDKSKETNRKMYMPLARLFIKNHPVCQAGLKGCTKVSKMIHHRKGRLGDLLLDTKHWLATCFNCHRHLEDHPKLAKENKHSESRLSK